MNRKNKHARPSRAELGIELEQTIGKAMCHSLPSDERKIVEERLKKGFR